MTSFDLSELKEQLLDAEVEIESDFQKGRNLILDDGDPEAAVQLFRRGMKKNCLNSIFCLGRNQFD